MAQCTLMLNGLSDDPVEAAAEFYSGQLDTIAGLLDGQVKSLAIQLPAASKSHDHWRRAAARDLARKYAPHRVNIVGGNVGVEIDAILTYLETAPGITGQYLAAHE